MYPNIAKKMHKNALFFVPLRVKSRKKVKITLNKRKKQ